MKNNFFKTLGEALEAVRAYLAEKQAVLVDDESFFNHFSFGGVQYGETKNRSELLATLKGKPVKRKGLTLAVYRMESGTYEAVAYIA